MSLKTSLKKKRLIGMLAFILLFSTVLSITAFAYYQNPSASVLFHWSKVISNSNPRVTVYGRDPSTGEQADSTIVNMNGLNGHSLYIDGKYRPVFCINPQQEADSYYLEGESFQEVRWGRLTANQQDLVLRALYCGYPNTVDAAVPDQEGTYPMNSVNAQHLALQAMIFNIRCGFVVKDGKGIKATRAYNDTDSFDERVSSDYGNIHTAYANLFDRMNSFVPSAGIPSFATLSTDTATEDKTIKLEYDSATGNYVASVTDTNGVLGYYDFSLLNGGGISCSVSGNTLTITATPSAAEALGTATRKGNVASSAPDVHLSEDDLTFYVASESGNDNYQTMVEYVSSASSVSYKKVYLMLQAEAKGYIRVSKASSDPGLTSGNSSYSLAGAVFSIYASRSDAKAKRNPVGTITTDADGNGLSAELTPGDYYVRETTAPPGYELSDDIHSVSVTAGETVTIHAEDSPLTKDFTLRKQSTYTGFSAGNSAYSLAGAEYGVYASKADAKADENRLETLITDASGNAVSTGRYALGKKLFIKELSASPGYYLDTQVYSLTIAAGETNEITVNEVPGSDSGHLRIRKVDVSGTKPKTITDGSAVFKVSFYPNDSWNGKAARTWYFKTVDGICWLNEAAYLDESRTNADLYIDADGSICFPIGTVKISEISAPDGYVRADVVLLARIAQDSSGGSVVWHWETEESNLIGYESKGAIFGNEPIRGSLEVVKKDRYETIYLSGAGFRVYDSSGKQVAEGYTGTDGKLIIQDLPRGEYTYQEFKAPQGFKLDEKVYSFSIAEDGATVSHTRVNERRPGTIEVKKQDTNGSPFAGVAFLLEYSTDDGSTWQPVFSRGADKKNITRGGCTSPGLTDGQLVSDESGTVRFTGLRADSKILYRLTETAAPEGCTLIAGSLYVGTIPVESTNIYASDAEVFGNKAFVYSLYVTATDGAVFRLPETGGSGFGFLPLAMLLCAAPIPIIIPKKNRKGENA